MKKQKTYLFTANPDVSAPFLAGVEELKNVSILHLPLEHVAEIIYDEEAAQVRSHLDKFTFIVYGNLRNARYFLKWVEDQDAIEPIRQIIQICLHQSVMDLLESHSIPGIMPRDDARPIDIIEFLLRISKEGSVLYPTKEQKGEELPGLLQELEIPVAEFTVCREVSVPDNDLAQYRSKLARSRPDGVLFHSRSAVTRILAAFPALDLNDMEIISSGHAVTLKLREAGLKPDIEAQSTWRSLLQSLSG